MPMPFLAQYSRRVIPLFANPSTIPRISSLLRIPPFSAKSSAHSRWIPQTLTLHRLFIVAVVLPGPLFGELPEFLLASDGQQKGQHRRALLVERRRTATGWRRIPQLDFRLSLGQHARKRARMGRRAEKSDHPWQYR